MAAPRSRVPPVLPGSPRAGCCAPRRSPRSRRGSRRHRRAGRARATRAESVVDKAELASAALAYFLVGLLVALVLWGAFELVRARGVGMPGAGRAHRGGRGRSSPFPPRGCASDLPPCYAVIVAAAATVAAIAGAYGVGAGAAHAGARRRALRTGLRGRRPPRGVGARDGGERASERAALRRQPRPRDGGRCCSRQSASSSPSPGSGRAASSRGRSAPRSRSSARSSSRGASRKASTPARRRGRRCSTRRSPTRPGLPPPYFDSRWPAWPRSSSPPRCCWRSSPRLSRARCSRSSRRWRSPSSLAAPSTRPFARSAPWRRRSGPCSLATTSARCGERSSTTASAASPRREGARATGAPVGPLSERRFCTSPRGNRRPSPDRCSRAAGPPQGASRAALARVRLEILPPPAALQSGDGQL